MRATLVAALARKEWREMLRDRLYLVLAFGLPTLLMLVFGHGMSQDVERAGLVVVDEDRSAASRDYVDHFLHARQFRRLAAPASAREAAALLQAGRARVLVHVPAGFGRALQRGDVATVQFVVDGSFTAPARMLRGYLEAINAAAVARLRAQALGRHGAGGEARTQALVEPLRLQVRHLHNEEVRSIWTVAPSLPMLILLLVPPLLMAVSVVREKESGAILHLRCSTLSRAELMAGKLLPALAVSFANAAWVCLLAVVYFGVPFRGSAAVLALGTALYLVATSALGLLVSLLVRSQQAAIIISTMLATIVATQFSGLFTPVESMTGASRWLAQLLPADAYRELLIGTFLQQRGIAALAPALLRIAAAALVLLLLCHALFRKRVRS
jgi:ABC-2 type transport system permease protein